MTDVERNTRRAMSEICDAERLWGGADALRTAYSGATPFPHIVLDDFLCPQVYAAALRGFPSADDPGWTSYVHVNERKRANPEPSTWDEALRVIAEVLTSDEFVRWVGEVTGFDDLLPDWSMDGGGLHQCLSGGHLNVHADFTAHHRVPTWRRRVNLLLYLNERWSPDWRGELELWSHDMARCEKSVAPTGNRLLLFTTDVDAYHGHPDPLLCPDGVARQSLALYYFAEEERPLRHSTDYRARPEDRWRAPLIYADKLALRCYDRIRGRLSGSERAVSAIMDRLRRR